MPAFNNPAVLRLALALLVAVTALLAGCAGTARGVERSVYREPEASRAPKAVPQSAPVPDSAALVVIRYPALIHAEAESFFVSSFAIKGIGGEVPYKAYGKPATERIARAVIAKSGYYAMSLYHELRTRLPEHRVLLSPHLVLWNEELQLHSRPILASEQVPTVLTVDFNVYSFPDASEMMKEPPVTFGDLVTPLMVVRTDHWARPGLNGLLMASEPLLHTAWRQSASLAAHRFEALLEGERAPAAGSLDFIAFLAERDALDQPLPARKPGDSSGRMLVEQYPVEKLQLNEDLVARIEEPNATDPFAVGFALGAATRIQGLLSEVDAERATFFARQAALARFDPELARVYFMQSQDESVRARQQLAEALVAAEREFLAAQSDSIYDGTYVGDYGLRLRKVIAAEYRMLEERRRLAVQQNMATAVAALALAGSVYGATVTTTASSAAVAAFTGVTLLGSMWAANRALDARTESREVSEAFIQKMAPTFERQTAVQAEWLESKEVITARGFAEFRTKTLSLYQSRVRSLTVSADTDCDFLHPGVAGPGRWYGACADGLASGPGFGLAGQGRGAVVEYLGEAQAGLAAGTGSMMLRPAGALSGTWYEGGFRAGQPDGSVRVEEAGASPKLREFESGANTGRASAAASGARP